MKSQCQNVLQITNTIVLNISNLYPDAELGPLISPYRLKVAVSHLLCHLFSAANLG